MTPTIRLTGRFGAATSAEVNALLGLAPKAKLPPEGMPERLVQGIRVYVRALAPKVARWRRMQHRVRAICPVCGADVSASRLPQHAKVHPIPNA